MASPGATDEDIILAAKDYVTFDTNDETRSVIQAQIDSQDVTALRKAMCSKLEFGTAGLRGPMEAGYGAMNEVTVMQATQGLAVYLEQFFGKEKASEGGVVIGYDHRAAGTLCSEKFAMIAAECLLARGIRVYLLPGEVEGTFSPTPLVAYGVLAKQAVAGIMVTASHNPKADDGYKVYWDNGAQIIPPHDSGIASGIEASRQPWERYGQHPTVSALIAASNGRCTAHTEELAAEYFAKIASSLCHHSADNPSNAKVVYTAMHGVGSPWFFRAFESFALPAPITVAAQDRPDPTFPTVAFPNPEEGAGALELAFAAAEANGATLVLANDPDADRLAVAEKGSDGAWRVLTGNEIGILLADWCWAKFKAKYPASATAADDASRPAKKRKGASDGGAARPRAAMLSSAVSSRMIGALAAAEGFHWEETLTGFKWLCSRAVELRQSGYEVLMCYEEAIGFCCGSVVNDKDGVSAGAVFAEMAGELKRQHNRSVCQHLDALYARLGQFMVNAGYVVCRQPKTTAAIFERLRNDGHYWLMLNGKAITSLRDLTTGVDTSTADGKATLPTSSSSHMITYKLSDGASLTLRGSGTEPKIKWYAEMTGTGARAEVKVKLDKLVEAIMDEMIQPEANGLERPKPK